MSIATIVSVVGGPACSFDETSLQPSGDTGDRDADAAGRDVRPNDSGGADSDSRSDSDAGEVASDADADGQASPGDDGHTSDASDGGECDAEQCPDRAGATCDGDATCLSGLCDGSGRCAHRIFVSSTRFTGDFGGLAGADESCNALAEQAGLTGTWKALLSGSNDDAKSRLAIEAAVIRMDGRVVAGTAEALWDPNAPPEHRVKFDARGREIRTCTCSGENDDSVWSGTKEDGTAGDATCDDWSRSDGSSEAASGDAGDLGDWLFEVPGRACDQAARIYCIDGQ